ncbi:MAG: hypothetical protein AVDCRST_MAG64-4154, partial [uncultured Phycisphaerae bacterium]
GRSRQPGIPHRSRPRRQLQGRALVREGDAAAGPVRGQGQHARPGAHRQGGEDAGRRRGRRDRGRGGGHGQ